MKDDAFVVIAAQSAMAILSEIFSSYQPEGDHQVDYWLCSFSMTLWCYHIPTRKRQENTFLNHDSAPYHAVCALRSTDPIESSAQIIRCDIVM